MLLCKLCGVLKNENEFYWKKNGIIKSYSCKKCYLQRIKKYRDSEKGKAVRKEYFESKEDKVAHKKANKK